MFPKTGLNTRITDIENEIIDLVIRSSLTDLTDFTHSKNSSNADVTEIEQKVPNCTGLIAKNDFHTKLTKMENKIKSFNDYMKTTNWVAIISTGVTNLGTKDDTITTLDYMMNIRDDIEFFDRLLQKICSSQAKFIWFSFIFSCLKSI